MREARGVGVLGGEGGESVWGKEAPGVSGRSAGDAVEPPLKNELTRDAAPVDMQPPAGVVCVHGVAAPATACALSPGACAVSGVSLPRPLSLEAMAGTAADAGADRVVTPGDGWASGGKRAWSCGDTIAVGVFVSEDTVAEGVVATWAAAEPFADRVAEAVVRGACMVLCFGRRGRGWSRRGIARELEG